jgi:hypothetical protein
MNQMEYYTLLHGGGRRCPGTVNLLYIPKTAKTIEERSKDKMCPPPQLNPEYLPSSKVKRSGQLPRQQQPQRTTGGQQRSGVDAAVLKRIFG